MGSRRANTLLQTGHSSLDFSSLPSRRPTEHAILTRVWHRDPLPCSAHTRALSRSSLSPLQPTTRAHTHTPKRVTKKNTAPQRLRYCILPVHTCQETKATRESCPGNMSNTPWEMQAPWHPPGGRARLYTQRTGPGLASGPGTSALPRLDPGFSSTPSHPAKGTILYSTRWRAQSGW